MPIQENSAPHVQIVSPVRTPSPVSSSTPDSQINRSGSFGNVTPSISKSRSDIPASSDPIYTRWLRNSMQSVLKHRWFSWVPKKLNWPALKPVIRCAIAAWLGLLVQLILPTERALGYAAFFVLVVAMMIPPSQPVVQNLEVLANLYFFTALAWGWLALGVFIAGQVRTPTDPAKIAAAEAKWAHIRGDLTRFNLHIIYDATYLEAKSAIVCAVFLAVGSGAFLWYKLRTQPSPATFPLVLSCILMDIGLTTAALYPYPLYSSALLFFLPMAVQGGIATVCSLTIFPESVGHSFQNKLNGVLAPLQSAMISIESLFDESVNANESLSPQTADDRLEDWADRATAVRVELLQSLAGVPPLRAQQRYLGVDISYGRLSGHDLRDLFDRVAVLQTRSGGLAFFFDVIVTNTRHLHLDSSAFSVHQATPSRPSSRPASLREPPIESTEGDAESENDDTPARRFHLPNIFHRRSGSPHAVPSQRGSHVSLLDQLRKAQQPVGVYESQRYMDVERAFRKDTDNILEQLAMLAVAALPLVGRCRDSLDVVIEWLKFCNKRRVRESKASPTVEEATGALQGALDDFHLARLVAVRPYRHVFDPAHPPSEEVDYRKLKHRGLFQVFVAQYHLALLRLLRMLEDFDKTRTRRRMWYPRPMVLLEHLRSSHTERHLTDGNDGHENDAAFNQDDEEDELGDVRRRNPEYTPWESPLLNLFSRLATATNIFHTRSFMYAVKAGVLTVLTTLPQFIASSAAFYYDNRGIWCAIMAQLTLAVYSGDTTSAWLGRCVASFWGSLLGMVVWYIGSGSGPGNPYGLAAICAFAFPIALFFRIHFPGQVLTAVMTPVTFGIVVGYSYLNATVIQLTSATWGWDVAWRRFVCVLIGITAAWIFSYLPPSYSSKRAIRQSYANTISAAGSILCEIISRANDNHNHITEDVSLRQKLLTWRSKLNKLGVRHVNATYEYSLRGRWPEERYSALREALQDLLSLLSQLNHVLAQLERPWRKALLERTRLCEAVFLGDVLAVISMCSTGLRSGTPLPQITPSPLVARFRMGKLKGLELPHDPVEYAGEIPTMVTVDVLESDDYMRYALGVTTTFSLLARLDRMVVICKTLLGENYHIGGVHLEPQAV